MWQLFVFLSEVYEVYEVLLDDRIKRNLSSEWRSLCLTHVLPIIHTYTRSAAKGIWHWSFCLVSGSYVRGIVVGVCELRSPWWVAVWRLESCRLVSREGNVSRLTAHRHSPPCNQRRGWHEDLRWARKIPDIEKRPIVLEPILLLMEWRSKKKKEERCIMTPGLLRLSVLLPPPNPLAPGRLAPQITVNRL